MQRMGRPQYAGYSIQGLAESVGFKSASNFVLAFKKVTGMPPSLYMKYAKKTPKRRLIYKSICLKCAFL